VGVIVYHGNTDHRSSLPPAGLDRTSIVLDRSLKVNEKGRNITGIGRWRVARGHQPKGGSVAHVLAMTLSRLEVTAIRSLR
jgi:hypothetical protein